MSVAHAHESLSCAVLCYAVSCWAASMQALVEVLQQGGCSELISLDLRGNSLSPDAEALLVGQVAQECPCGVAWAVLHFAFGIEFGLVGRAAGCQLQQCFLSWVCASSRNQHQLQPHQWQQQPPATAMLPAVAINSQITPTATGTTSTNNVAIGRACRRTWARSASSWRSPQAPCPCQSQSPAAAAATAVGPAAIEVAGAAGAAGLAAGEQQEQGSSSSRSTRRCLSSPYRTWLGKIVNRCDMLSTAGQAQPLPCRECAAPLPPL